MCGQRVLFRTQDLAKQHSLTFYPGPVWGGSTCVGLNESILILFLLLFLLSTSPSSTTRVTFVNLGANSFGKDNSVVGGRPVHCRKFSSVPGLCPQNASSTIPQVVTTKNVSRYHQMSPEGQHSPILSVITTPLRKQRCS